MCRFDALLPFGDEERPGLSCSFLPNALGELCVQVEDQEPQTVFFRGDGQVDCTCGSSGPCVHMRAALEKAEQAGLLEEYRKNSRAALGEKMLREMTRMIPGSEGIRLQTSLKIFPGGEIGLGLALGRERLIAVKNIQDLLTSYHYGISLKISDSFVYSPLSMRFPTEDERLLSLLGNYLPLKAASPEEWENLLRYSEGASHSQQEETAAYAGRFLYLRGALLYSVLHYFESHDFVLINGTEKTHRLQIRKAELPLVFRARLEPTRLTIETEDMGDLRLLSEDGRFVFHNGRILHISAPQARVCRLLCRNGLSFSYPAADCEKALSTLLPALSTIGSLIPEGELSARLITDKLEPVVYLDMEGQSVAARVEFRYGDVSVNPFLTGPDSDPSGDGRRPTGMLLRDGHRENAILTLLGDAGFIVQDGRILLRKSRDILEFCSRGVVALQKESTVYASEAFSRIKPRKLSARAAFIMRGSHLVMRLLGESGQELEVLPVLHAVVARQEYVRMKNGEFLDIRDLSGFSDVMRQLVEANELDALPEDTGEKELSFRAYRSTYMISMLQAAGMQTEADAQVEQAMGSFAFGGDEGCSYLEAELRASMTGYQCQGINWLFSLYNARLGGILADEMGLGKTAQVIATLSAARKRDGTSKSIIVTPTSLTYHWLAEFKRFGPEMVVRAVNGPRQDRIKTIQEAGQASNVDVILTTYPLLRRDIDLLKTIPFRFAILDEAQSVKNAQSLGSLAVKELNAQVHMALTGTPMENHTGELWSLFDFILPGYLGSQSSFLRRYGGGEHTEELQNRIRPFLLRRLKSDVMTSLPKKREQVLYSAMTEGQEAIYNSLMQSLRGYVSETLRQGDLPRARIQVLSLLLKLRQVCCHPKLYMADYEGTSGKLELLTHLVEDGLANRHRILIFSQFVGMLQLIRKRLNREGVQTLYLDGSTKPEQRQEMCDRFNGGEGKVFLISLKAGGVGLNLTGADLVIHYDPWWNPAAEDQATDRAHRIGQNREVDVIRLITQNTIEEKVCELGEKKRSLFEKIIVAGEEDLSALTEEDIRRLFLMD